MTTGSWNRSSGSLPGHTVTYTKTWNGGDRALQNYPKPEKYTVTRNGQKYTFYKKRPYVEKPPKRAYDVDHPYSCTITRLRDGPCGFIRADNSVYNGRAMADTVPPQWNTPVDFDANAQLKLLGKLREKTSGSDFNMSLFLGEGHQTLRMIGDTAIQIAKSAHHLRRGDLAGAARSLLDGTNRRPIRPYKEMKPFRPTAEQVSRRWLELQYGWKPLLQDVKAGAEFLAHKLSAPVSTTVRMSHKTEIGRKQVLAGAWKGGPAIGTSLTTWRRSLKLTISEPPSFLAQLGLLDPEVVAWELVPFSFVADWFLPIGDYLNARAALSHVVISQTLQTDMIVGRGFPPTGPCITGMDPDCGYEQIRLTRVILAGPPKVPLPRVKPLSEALSFGHAMNGLALVAQAFVGHSKKKERDQRLTDSLPPASHRNGIIPRA